MDVSTLKRHKHCNAAAEEDRISKLPDSILSHILSFLKTLDSVRTSCLSRRWRYLWTSATVLDFEDALYADQCKATYLAEKSQHFESFVNTVFILLTNSSIKKLRLNLSLPCCDYRSSSYVNSWILDASARNVEELDITAKYIEINIPRNSKKLVTLKLCSMLSPIFPELVNLPSLKVLYLSGKCLPFTCMSRIISGCPVLEDLVIHSYYCHSDIQTLSVASASLKLLLFVNLKSNSYNVILDAPRLKFLYLRDAFSQEPLTEINDFSSIQRATFDFSHCGDNLLQHCRLPIVEKFKMEALSLSFFTLMKALAGKSTDKLHCSVKLTRLVLGYCGADLKILSSVLESFPNLQVLKLNYLNCNHAVDCEALEKEKHEIYCLKHSLKILKLGSFTGKEAEMRVIGYFLRNAEVLRMVRIFTKEESEAEVLKKLLMFPRCSKTCQIAFFSSENHIVC